MLFMSTLYCRTVYLWSGHGHASSLRAHVEGHALGCADTAFVRCHQVKEISGRRLDGRWGGSGWDVDVNEQVWDGRLGIGGRGTGGGEGVPVTKLTVACRQRTWGIARTSYFTLLFYICYWLVSVLQQTRLLARFFMTVHEHLLLDHLKTVSLSGQMGHVWWKLTRVCAHNTQQVAAPSGRLSRSSIFHRFVCMLLLKSYFRQANRTVVQLPTYSIELKPRERWRWQDGFT